MSDPFVPEQPVAASASPASDQPSLMNPALSPGEENDDLIFAEESKSTQFCAASAWKLLIVDDEEEVHAITRIVLEGLTFSGKPLTFLSAYSAAEARILLQEHQDIAAILLDVVMETGQAGLELVEYIRNELGNTMVRIILRTGQAGQAPEREVITRYDINDYKHKTELTAQKLFSTVTTAIRSYHDLRTIEQSRRGLEMIIASSKNLFGENSIRQFATGVLDQMISLLQLNEDCLFLHAPSGFAATVSDGSIGIIAGTGEFHDCNETGLPPNLDPDIKLLLHEALHKRESIFSPSAFVRYYCSASGSETLFFFRLSRPMTSWETNLIQVFCGNVAVALDNMYLNQELVFTQKEIILTLGECVESRSKETASHVRRVSECCSLLATLLNFSPQDVKLIRMASPMHDVGKIGIPDAILLKPGPLTTEEFEIIKTHTTIGYHILKSSERPIMRTAAIIAHEHHEYWNGSGYPRALAGEAIHPFGRITCLVDVFDSLLSRRVYKEAWELERALKYIEQEKGKMFDPAMVDTLFAHIDVFIATRLRFPDAI
ncbi:response regulator [Desulfovibrionales bacterium]